MEQSFINFTRGAVALLIIIEVRSIENVVVNVFCISNLKGTNEDYKITWMDPKGPIINHPAFPNSYTDRYCNQMTTANYVGDPEPTRTVKNGETENCVTIVFLPHPKGRGKICLADDFCSQRMSYVCELSIDFHCYQ